MILFFFLLLFLLLVGLLWIVGILCVLVCNVYGDVCYIFGGCGVVKIVGFGGDVVLWSWMLRWISRLVVGLRFFVFGCVGVVWRWFWWRIFDLLWLLVVVGCCCICFFDSWFLVLLLLVLKVVKRRIGMGVGMSFWWRWIVRVLWVVVLVWWRGIWVI